MGQYHPYDRPRSTGFRRAGIHRFPRAVLLVTSHPLKRVPESLATEIERGSVASEPKKREPGCHLPREVDTKGLTWSKGILMCLCQQSAQSPQQNVPQIFILGQHTRGIVWLAFFTKTTKKNRAVTYQP